jgi:hypothetical protein
MHTRRPQWVTSRREHPQKTGCRVAAGNAGVDANKDGVIDPGSLGSEAAAPTQMAESRSADR